MATENGGSMWDATPLLSVALVECLRTPVAMRIPHLKLGGALCAIALCIGITPVTGEAMMLAADRLFHARTANVYAAEEVRDEAKAKYEASHDAATARDKAIADARAHEAEIAAQKPALQQVPPTIQCNGHDKRNRPISWACPNPAQEEATKGNKKAQAEYDERVKAAQKAVADSEATSAVDVKALERTLKTAEADVTKAKDHSAMHRAAASWFGVSVAQLTDAQYEKFARICMIAIAASVSFVTMISAFISNLPSKDGRAGKLVNAIRARLAAKRKTLRKLVPTIVTQFKERVRYVHVPVDAATGTILADVPPEARFGDNVRPFNRTAAE
jgi:hypothetical protein